MGLGKTSYQGLCSALFWGKLVPSLSGKLEPGKGETGRPGRFSAHTPTLPQSPGGVPRDVAVPSVTTTPHSAAAIAPPFPA